jgi:hypothetical protein
MFIADIKEASTSLPVVCFLSLTVKVYFPHVTPVFFYIYIKVGIEMLFLFKKELTVSPVMSYDPLPPVDSVAGYTRPERYDQQLAKLGYTGKLFQF